jgi:hypothetical protein
MTSESHTHGTPAPVCLPRGGDRTGLKIWSLLNAHMTHDHVGAGAWRSLAVPSKLLPNKLLPFCGHPTSSRQLWTSIQEITVFQNQKFHNHQRWLQLNLVITQYQQNAPYWTLSREIQPRRHNYSVFEDLILLRYDIMSNDSYRRWAVACCFHNQSPRSQLFFWSWRIREVNVFADMKI